MTLSNPNELTPSEQATRDSAELDIREGLYRMWKGFAVIRDGRLWRSTHTSFEAYCRDLWGHGEKRGYQLAEAGELVKLLESVNAVLPENERHARELVKFPTDLQPIILKTTTSLASSLKKRVTAEMIERVGTTLLQAITTGVADVNGEATPLDAALVENEHEAMLRQQEHVRNGSRWLFEAGVAFKSGRDGIMEVMQMLHGLDPAVQHSIRAYKEKVKDEEG